jgi:NAD(P)H-dependent FMN reductase
MRIEIISGSPRVNSVSRRVAIHLKNWIIENTEHEVDIIDLRDWNLPSCSICFCITG